LGGAVRCLKPGEKWVYSTDDTPSTDESWPYDMPHLKENKEQREAGMKKLFENEWKGINPP
jgi:hypothetical protein